MLDLAAAYGFLVAGGQVTLPRVLADDPPQRAAGSISAQASWLVMDMLSDPDARRAVFGADLPLDMPFKVAAKTGTSSGFADTVAVGATSEAVAAAWAGDFDGSGTRGTLAMWSAAPLVRAALLAVSDLAGRPLTLPDAPVDSHFKRHFPSPEENADNRPYVNYIHLHAQNIPIPKGKQAQFCGSCHNGHGPIHVPTFGDPVSHHSGPGGST